MTDDPHTTHRYRGHRANSFVPIDLNELVEIRARQRTFDGAYRRTALGNLGYSLAILRLFDRRFLQIGFLYAALAAVLSIIAFLRSRHSRHDFADRHLHCSDKPIIALPTVGQEGKRVFGRPFITAGWIVIAVGAVVAVMEIVLLVLVFELTWSR